MFDIYINYDLTRNSRSIGEVTASLTLKFKEKKVEQISKYYIYILDFLDLSTLEETCCSLSDNSLPYLRSNT